MSDDEDLKPRSRAGDGAERKIEDGTPAAGGARKVERSLAAGLDVWVAMDCR